MLLVNAWSICQPVNLILSFAFIFCTYHLSYNFNYSNFLLLINNSVGIRYCNHQPSSHVNGVC